MLTTAVARAATARARAYKIFDAAGLYLRVASTGTKTWRMRYRWRGREKLLTFGRFPEVALAEARARCEEARAQIRAGVDPAELRQGEDDEPEIATFAQLPRAWFAHKREGWSATHAADVIGSLERHVLPHVGTAPLGTIQPPELLKLLRAVEGRGHIETARRLRQRLSEIFAFGIAEGHCSNDPAARLGAAMRGSRPVRPHSALTAIQDCRALLVACRLNGPRSVVQLASEFLALTAVRLEALRGARWSEIEDLDGPEPQWRVPPARMKLARAKKDEARFEHVVPLCPQAVRVLRETAEIKGHDTLFSGGLIFPGRVGTTPLGERAIGALYAQAGFAGRHVPHGWRASFSTILNEQLGEDWRGDIDRALAHAPKNKVEAAYNRAQQLQRRRQLYKHWGALLAG